MIRTAKPCSFGPGMRGIPVQRRACRCGAGCWLFLGRKEGRKDEKSRAATVVSSRRSLLRPRPFPATSPDLPPNKSLLIAYPSAYRKPNCRPPRIRGVVRAPATPATQPSSRCCSCALSSCCSASSRWCWPPRTSTKHVSPVHPSQCQALMRHTAPRHRQVGVREGHQAGVPDHVQEMAPRQEPVRHPTILTCATAIDGDGVVETTPAPRTVSATSPRPTRHYPIQSYAASTTSTAPRD